MAEGNGKGGFLGGGFGQILVTVLSALVMTLLAWAWNLTQDVRLLMDARPKLASIEQILEGVRTGMEALANRTTKIEVDRTARERDVAAFYTQLHDLADDVGKAQEEIISLRASMRYLENREQRFPLTAPPAER